MKKTPDKKQITPLAEFCTRRQISRNQLSEIAGGDAHDASKSMMQRLLHDQITDADYKAKLRKSLADNLPSFLISRGLSISEINRELTAIFNQGEYQPMITERKVLPKSIQTFFKLSDDPFSKTPQSRRDVFMTSEIKNVVDEVIDSIRYQGFISVTGDIGSGKTVVRSVVEDYVAKDSKLRLIFPESYDMSRVTAANISRAILEEFGVEKIPNDAVARTKKVKNLLAGLYKDGVRVAIGFDESHRKQDATVSALKNFHEMNSGGFQKYLGIVLFGQPAFKTKLNGNQFREIFERVVQIDMPQLAEFASQYLDHRLRLVGGNLTELFDDDAIGFVTENAATPLALGNIANAMLIHSRDFNNHRVIGEAVKAKMNFAQPSKTEQEFKKRAAK